MSQAGPVFVGGAGRSGKTLVRWMLSSHSRIVVSRRTEMWPRFYGRFGDLRRPENFERCLRAMLDRKQIASLGPDPERLRRDFWQGAPTYARLFELFHEQYLQPSGKARWGDQTGLIERYADEVISAYPGARIVHLIRDPRDRHEAVAVRDPRRPGALGQSTATWLSSVALARRNLERYPDSYLLVRYETLVTSPERTMRDVCAFLDEEFEPAMVRMEGVRRYDNQRAAAADGSPISTAFVGRYRHRLSPCELAFIQTIARQQMLAFGYPPDPIRLSASERVRCAVTCWPASLARMGLNLILQASHRRPPGGGSQRPRGDAAASPHNVGPMNL